MDDVPPPGLYSTDPLMRPVAAWVSDVGKVRESNEDSLLADERLGIFAVADGMGGRNGGEVASRITVDVVLREIQLAREPMARVRFGEEGPELARDILARAVQEACAAVYAHAKEHPETKGMGCTLTALLTVGEHAIMAHVGDSRLYLVRAGKLHQLSSDYTMAAELVRSGGLSAEKARHHRWNHVLTRVVGTQPSVPVETLLLPAMARDRFMLCSDGIYNELSEEEIKDLLVQYAPSEAPQRMIERVLERAATDNATCVVVELAGNPGSRTINSARAEDALAMLRRSFLCEGMGVREVAQVFSFCEVRALKPGQVVLDQDDQLERLILCVSGKLTGHRDGLPVADLEEGDLLGETTLIRGRPIRGTLRAAGPTVVLELSALGLRRMRRMHPELGAHVLNGLALRLSREVDRANWRLEALDDPQSADDPSVL